jgi:hypothetical protein
MKKHLWSIAALLVMVFLALGSTSGTSGTPSGGSASGTSGGSASDTPSDVSSVPSKTPEEIHREKVARNFSFWDGSHDGLTEAIKKSMHNPSSYEHVETQYIDKGDFLIVTTEFRGTNAFGGIVKNSMTAKADLNGNIIEIITSLDRLSNLLKTEVTPPKETRKKPTPPPIRKKYLPPPPGEGIAGPSKEELGNEPNLQNSVKPPQAD